ncbi:hypothetical protein P43SY_001117 [Pythium insidiosum]|uniref:Purple acid phosphatase n=1 Tax=Pythium insidiosum TaxID=114742 RepID=A0AAD5LRL7_PYTIN|nr:hypothetical protein P43SY_001117 [Pythium insidiosum]
MKLASLVALAGLSSAAAQAPIVNDDTCVWNLLKVRCDPEQYCSYQYKFGDWTLSQSCRVRPGANVPSQPAPSQPVVDDATCVWNYGRPGCEPAALCSYQYRFGDLTLGQSCRVRPGVHKMPQQLHLAYAGASTGSAMAISWATFADVTDSTVWIGTTKDNLVRRSDVKVSSQSYYSDDKYSLYQHHATVTGLQPNTKYFYKVGSALDATFVSEVGSFTTARAANDETPFEMAVFGDHGVGLKGEIMVTTGYLNSIADRLAFIYHVGDIAYADNDLILPGMTLGFFYEEVYNKWMNALTPVMSKVPYMVTVGNHEAECHSPACQVSNYKKDRLGNYQAYNARFKMPSTESGGAKNMWYSFEYGPIHFTSISSETDYPNHPSNEYILTDDRKYGNFGNQLAWLEADLKKAAANRANVPWIIVGMHRPMYHLSGNNNGKPVKEAAEIQKAFEELFIKYGVDLVIAGHEHSYERHLPIKRGQAVLDGVSADRKTYANPKAPVYIVTGAAGNPEINHGTGKGGQAWNVVEKDEYAISLMKVTRKELTLRHVTSGDERLLDELKITKA